MLEIIEKVDWKEVTKKNGFWIGLGLIAFATAFAIRGCAEAAARSEEARYKYQGGIWQNKKE